MISSRLFEVAQCPDCAGQLTRVGGRVVCDRCRREFDADGFLDLRPLASFSEQTKYLDEALHTDERHQSISPPVLGSKIRNDVLRRFLNPEAGDRVVDLGCGNGRAIAWNAATGASIVGVDISPHFAPEAIQRFDLMLGDLRRLPLRSGAFTKAWTLDVLEHLSPQAFRDVLTEANRVLADDGQLFVYTHVRKNGWIAGGTRAVNRLARVAERAGLIDLRQERLRKSDHLNPIADHDELRRVLADCGFQIERITYYTPVVGAFIENVLARIAERWLTRRHARRTGSSDMADDARRGARASAQARVNRQGLTYRALLALTAIMRLDVILFGRLRSGPYFALLRKTARVHESRAGSPTPAG